MKTAVDYIKEKLMCNEYWYENMTFDQIFEQAKEMEKEQIIAAHKTATLEAGFEHSADDWANQYYNQTYKSI